MTIVYRELTTPDIPTICSLMSELGYQINADTLQSRIADIRTNGGDVLVAESEGNVIGCINVIIDIRLAEGKAGEIVSLVVAETHRGLGVGKGLVDYAESWLGSRCELIRIRANNRRDQAHQFYRSLGYQEIKSQKVFTKNL